ncbi:ectoine/hydroxyectoine ABC transporter substrate-binding protein EhuB [Chelativorans sp. Marseille-P2723]|uniref:ectoine/hydroxyectoine ABC transporter substrate-binding protein EhuB n=1 Tax=Chelativorans sp. Marseille-P2723 TaxID=2709133 RepID=UPI001FEEC6D9|nr:ectoine/hydroxyectoine ABC transporter substrate-binding protein EhuB [Chelativorans sp. Marseille-P2723]
MRRTFLKGMVALCAIAASLGTAAAQSTLERAREQGYIRVGFANEAPYGYATPAGELTGESPEVAKEILSRMGIEEVDGVLTEFGSLIPGLMAGRFDIIAAGMFITPERCQQAAFSEPSYGIGQALLVPEGNPKNLVDYSSIADNSEITLAVMAGAVEADYAKMAGIADDQLVILPDQASLVSAVRSGRADAAALTALSIQRMAQSNEGVESTEPFAEVAGESVMGHGGFVFRPDDTELLEEFNRQLQAFIGTQEHIELVSEFGFGDGYLPTKTTEELCSAS